MDSIDKKLKDLYSSKIINLKNTNFDEFAGPFLMSERAKNYSNQNKKILFIGKEANGWMDGTLAVDFLMDYYKTNQLKSSNIWRFIYQFHNELNSEYKDQFEFYWTNISKFSKLDGTSLENKDFINLYEKFNVLQDELQIIKPDFVLFFSHGKHDDWLHWQFEDNIKWEKVIGFSDNELMKLSHENLPYNSFRTYHPDYLNRNTILKTKIFDEIINQINNQ
jgi:hypothetical protein